MSIEESHSMTYNGAPQRLNNNVMNYTTKIINNIDLRTDVGRLTFENSTGVDQMVEGASGSNWANVFVTTNNVGVYPKTSTLNTKMSSNWNMNTKNAPLYKGNAEVMSVYGHIVLKQADGVQNSDNIQLSIWTKKTPTSDAPNPVYTMLDDSMSSIAIPDISHSINKATSTLTVNVVIPISKGESIQLRIRNGGMDQVNYKYYKAILSCRPIGLHGTDKNI